MQKVLFIDRDGTIIVEPPEDYQVDSFEKLAFLPGAITNLAAIVRELDYQLVMVTNQDGLGMDSFPEETFWPVHNKMLEILASEGIGFEEVCIDRSFESDSLPTRKPNVGMLYKYIHGPYDLANSYVLGDRASDVRLAENLGSKSIYLGDESDVDASLVTKDWTKIYQHLKGLQRVGKVSRKTSETSINVYLDLDGEGKSEISTGLGFYDHMLEQISRHGNMDLLIKTEGDLHIDEHHTIEDTAIALGKAFYQAIGSKKGIERYGFMLPMDDCLAQVAIDFGGRPWIEWEATFTREKIGDVPTELFYHFFKSFSDNAMCNLNIKAEGSNEHHKIESIFKAFAKAIKMAVKQNGEFRIPSTKGVL